MHHRQYVVRVGIFFLILFTADTSYDTILTYMFEQKHMPQVGPTSIAVLYLAFTISLIIAPAVTLPLKTQFVISSLAFILNYALGFYASTCSHISLVHLLVSFGTGVAGLANGLLWVSQGRYIHLICSIFDRDQDRGQLYSLFGLFYCSSFIGSAIVTVIGFGYFSTTTYFTVLIVLSTLAFLYCVIFIKDIDEIGTDRIRLIQSSSEDENRYNQMERISVMLQNEVIKKQHYDILSFLQKFFSFIPSMLSLFPFFLIKSICYGVKTNLLYHLLPSSFSHETANKYMGYMQIVGGGASVIGIYLTGFIFDVLSTVLSGRIIAIIYFFSCWIMIVAMQIQNVVVAMLMMFLWAFELRCVSGVLPAICSKHFQGKAQGFSVIKLVPAFFNSLFQVYMILANNSMSKEFFAFLSLLMLPALYCLSFIPKNQPAEQTKEESIVKQEQI